MAGKSKQFTVEARDKIASILSELPEKSKAEMKMITQDMIESLKAEIKSAQNKGYTIEEIVQLFKEGGINIGITTFKLALKHTKKKTSLKLKNSNKKKNEKDKNNQINITTSAQQRGER